MGRAHTGMQRWEREGRWGRGGEGGGTESAAGEPNCRLGRPRRNGAKSPLPPLPSRAPLGGRPSGLEEVERAPRQREEANESSERARPDSILYDFASTSEGHEAPFARSPIPPPFLCEGRSSSKPSGEGKYSDASSIQTV